MYPDSAEERVRIMIVYYTEFSLELMSKIIQKTSIDKCSLNIEQFRNFLFVAVDPTPGYSKFFSAYVPVNGDKKLNEKDFIKKCIELYPPKKGE